MHFGIKLVVLTALTIATASGVCAQQFEQGRSLTRADDFAVLSHKARIEPENAILHERMKQLLPTLMAQANIDMWLVINREYAEDPVYFTLVPQPSHAARRTTMLVFSRNKDGTVEHLSVNRYPLGEPYKTAWSGGNLAQQWQALAALIEAKNPDRIGINVSEHWPVADGLTHGLHQRLLDALPDTYEQRLVSAEDLVVRWVETRTAKELAVYPQIVALARSVIAEAFSNRVITPGVTTTDDVAWYIRNRFAELQLQIWFQPYVTLQRAGHGCDTEQAFCGQSGHTIERGDVIHTDIGICYLKLCTDTQELGYVLPLGMTEVPGELSTALSKGNQWQDHLTEAFQVGRSGNEILAATVEKSEQHKLNSSTYTHPLGFYGHAPGPTIGMWDNQGPTPVRGDWPVYANTAYAIEGNVKVPLDMWDGQNIQIMLEQSAFFDGKNVIYLAGRQTKWHVIH
ncbi:hypothetical protein PSI9734_01725 [Pseudidiomarina piscicola]|uniref:Peptidase M24 domain-containing protein n=1 Tax=Pseudidiomarina piscicola TaxID=2614830 RepID=A0A6S6WP09_9GAMM|nr:M24 family metallopeptidase [Pseudidiomarina piscicola]CAB0151336.1 hypothetical protein PSI9734_01725 [Pseudidiomarina piscicola]VZT40817.1 hypothetical protein PSI9734_01725 [Pseudomonas aeruginosa]